LKNRSRASTGSSRFSSFDNSSKAPRKFVAELVNIAGKGVCVGVIGRRHFIRLVERRDLAQRAGNPGERARHALRAGLVGRTEHLHHALDHIHLAFGHRLDARGQGDAPLRVHRRKAHKIRRRRVRCRRQIGVSGQHRHRGAAHHARDVDDAAAAAAPRPFPLAHAVVERRARDAQHRRDVEHRRHGLLVETLGLGDLLGGKVPLVCNHGPRASQQKARRQRTGGKAANRQTN
jgi:hypothetical protein